MDATDYQILDILQKDATTPIAEISARVGLTSTPCWKRIQKLESSGVITNRVALLSPEALGLGLTAYVSIVAQEKTEAWFEDFAQKVADMPEVMEFHRMAGDIDFMLRVQVADIAAYYNFYRRLMSISPLRSAASHFSMERIKTTTALPLA